MSEKLKKELAVLQNKRTSLVKKIKVLHSLSLDLVVGSGESVDFDVRFDKLEANYESFSRCHNEILKIMITLGHTDIEAQQAYLDEVDEMYFHILATKRKLAPNETVLDTSTASIKPQVKLPKIDLPTFDGKLKEWPHFRDMFKSLIHDNDSLSNIEKYHYLASSLKGEPLSLAKTLPLTSQNYEIVWTQLQERYDNKRFLATQYFEEIVNLPVLHTESPKKLRSVLDLCTENTIALKALRFPVDYGDFVLMYIILQRLDKHTRQLFERKYSSTEFPTLDQLLSFLKDHCKSLEASSTLDKPQPLSTPHSKPRTYGSPKPPAPPRPYNAYAASVKAQICLFCNEDHVIYRCPKFYEMTATQRHDFIKSKQACFNCLSTRHTLRSCTSTSTCRKCSRRHHTMLHENPAAKAETEGKGSLVSKSQSPNTPSSGNPASTAVASATLHGSSPTSTALLATAAIQVKDFSGQYQTVRALLDPGSQMSFITENCVKRLALPRKRFTASISGISGSSVHNPKGLVTCTVRPRFREHPCLQASAAILCTITTPLPALPLSPDVKAYFSNLELADPFFDVPGKVDFLIGADLYPEVCDGGRLRSPTGYPTPYRTIFGWVLLGKTSACVAPNPNRPIISSNLSVTQALSLDSSIRKFWEIEEPPSKHHVSDEDRRAEAIFSQTTIRDSSGRYVVNLPFRQDPPDLGESYHTALQNLNRLEIRLSRSPDLRNQYEEFMNEYEALGHMKKVDLHDAKPKYFIPHHAVVKKGSDLSKLRVVFNGSSPTSNGQSLNDQLLTGPKLQNDICRIICNFRIFPVVFTADICKMYRQIMVQPNHQEYQAILWRKSPNHPIDCYLLSTVTYGLSSAPYLAIRTLHQLAKDEGHRFPAAAESLMNDIFVDDILVGTNDIESELRLKSDLIELLSLGGFQLKKWLSNLPDVLQDIPESCQEMKFTPDKDCTAAVKVLGIKWQPTTDVFMYQVCLNEFQSRSMITKRLILSLTSTLFDPLGWVTPVILFAKKLIQTLWTMGIGWDDSLSDEILNDWFRFVEELPMLEDIRIPRQITLGLSRPNYTSIQLHGFSDGSCEAYGACLYLRSESSCGQVVTKLVVAKSKVAPLKMLTIPKLELCGALLLCKLIDFYKQSLSNKLGDLPVFAWTDSTIVLHWIKTSPHLLKTYVANRLSMIQNIIASEHWHYVSTTDNPADCASRSLLPSQILSHKLWWNGPSWLLQDITFWPNLDLPFTRVEELPEVKSTTLLATSRPTVSEPTDVKFIENFSNLVHLKRVTSWCLRFINNCRTEKSQCSSGPITALELNKSLLSLIKVTQATYLNEDLLCVESGKPCRPAVQRLAPFLDQDGTLRVGGRLRHTKLQFSSRHPVLLPKNCHFTRLLIDHYHQTYFHVGPRQLQALLQRNFWILSVRNAIRKRLSRCVRCVQLKAESCDEVKTTSPDRYEGLRVQSSTKAVEVGRTRRRLALTAARVFN